MRGPDATQGRRRRRPAWSVASRGPILHTAQPCGLQARAPARPAGLGERLPMTSPAPRRGRTIFIVHTAAALLAGALLAQAQQPPAGSAATPPATPPAAAPAAPAKKAPAKSGATEAAT